MQKIIHDTPYVFVPPKDSWFWPRLLFRWLPRLLRKYFGIVGVECRGAEHLNASLAAGHGILLAPNHCRLADPPVMGMLAKHVRRPFYAMASRFLFEIGRMQTFILQRCGAFSVWREGLDRDALRAASDILTQAKRPLVVFPEGRLTRTNDRLGQLTDGVAFMARTAAKARAAQTPAGKVVIHPTAIRYVFDGDVGVSVGPVLDAIERRLTWTPDHGESLLARIRRIGEALLALKEIRYFGQPRNGDLANRLSGLLERLLAPLEKEWLGGRREPDASERIKKLRTAILSDMIGTDIPETERARRWTQLADIYLAQSVANYPPDYVRSRPTVERVIETVERFEEDLTDYARPHGPMRAIVQVDAGIEVSPVREKGPAGDPLMNRIRERIEAMLADLGKDARLVDVTQPAAAG